MSTVRGPGRLRAQILRRSSVGRREKGAKEPKEDGGDVMIEVECQGRLKIV
jgi:hypothetical protein